MSVSNGQYRSILSICCTCFTTVDKWCALCYSEARAKVSFVFHASDESWSRNGECIAEGNTSVLTELLSTCMLLIAGFSCGSAGVAIWLLSSSFLVLAVILKADQINWLWMLESSLPPVWRRVLLADQSTCISCLFSWSCALPSLMLFLAIDLRVLLLQRVQSSYSLPTRLQGFKSNSV